MENVRESQSWKKPGVGGGVEDLGKILYTP